MRHPVLVAGPCVIESESHCLRMAEVLKRIADRYDMRFYFKASFDKANRTSIKSYRGPGLMRGLEILSVVKEQIGCLVTSDIHEPYQASLAARVLDLIQIPAFLCRQTSLICAASDTSKALNVKKGQFLAPEDMDHVFQKIAPTSASKSFVTERGTLFGPGHLVVDMLSLSKLRSMGFYVLFDATHTNRGESGNTAVLAKAAAAVGVEGWFMEVHNDPTNALCDGKNMLDPNQLRDLLPELLDIMGATR